MLLHDNDGMGNRNERNNHPHDHYRHRPVLFGHSRRATTSAPGRFADRSGEKHGGFRMGNLEQGQHAPRPCVTPARSGAIPTILEQDALSYPPSKGRSRLRRDGKQRVNRDEHETPVRLLSRRYCNGRLSNCQVKMHADEPSNGIAKARHISSAGPLLIPVTFCKS